MFCRRCGARIEEEISYCTQCGAPTGESQALPQTKKQSKTGRVLKWTGIGCGGLVGLIILLAIIGIVVGDGTSTDNLSNPRESSQQQATATPSLSSIPFEQLKEMALDTISYDDLFRNNEAHVDKLVYYRAKVVQVTDGSSDRYVLRADVTESECFWEDTVWLHYTGSRLLDDDLIELVGRVKGLKTYEALFGNSVTIPEIDIIQARLVSNGER